MSKRCPGCSKHMNLTAQTCRFCLHTYCMSCRLPELHGCKIDKSKLIGDQLVTKNNWVSNWGGGGGCPC